jgi:hypothetical protein
LSYKVRSKQVRFEEPLDPEGHEAESEQLSKSNASYHQKLLPDTVLKVANKANALIIATRIMSFNVVGGVFGEGMGEIFNFSMSSLRIGKRQVFKFTDWPFFSQSFLHIFRTCLILRNLSLAESLHFSVALLVLTSLSCQESFQPPNQSLGLQPTVSMSSSSFSDKLWSILPFKDREVSPVCALDYSKKSDYLLLNLFDFT